MRADLHVLKATFMIQTAGKKSVLVKTSFFHFDKKKQGEKHHSFFFHFSRAQYEHHTFPKNYFFFAPLFNWFSFCLLQDEFFIEKQWKLKNLWKLTNIDSCYLSSLHYSLYEVFATSLVLFYTWKIFDCKSLVNKNISESTIMKTQQLA